MPIQVVCPACGRALRVPDNLIGQQVRCPGCMSQFVGRASVGEPFSHEGSFRPLEEPPALPRGREEVSERIHERESGPHAGPPPLPRRDDFDDEDDFEDDQRFRRDRYRQEAIRRITGPANGVLAIGVIGLVVSGIGVVYTLSQLGNARGGLGDAEVILAFGVLLRVAHIALSIVIIQAANKMKKLESHGFCKTMAILSAIPIISPCCILGLIFGLQANTVLSDPRVKDVFSS